MSKEPLLPLPMQTLDEFMINMREYCTRVPVTRVVVEVAGGKMSCIWDKTSYNEIVTAEQILGIPERIEE